MYEAVRMDLDVTMVHLVAFTGGTGEGGSVYKMWLRF